MLHFASIFLYDDIKDGWGLVFESNIDGEVDPYLRRLIAVCEEKDGGAFLLGLFSHCYGFSGDDLPSLLAYWKTHLVNPQAGYVAGVGITRNQVLMDDSIYQVVNNTLGSGAKKMEPAAAQAAILAALEQADETKGRWSTDDDDPNYGTLQKLKSLGSLVVSAFCFIGLGIINLIPERTARQDNERPDKDMVREQQQNEDILPTNHMVSVVHLQTDAPRLWAKRCGFGLLKALVILKFNKGHLGPIDTIHFAHWAFLNDNRRMLFVSNYGGGWDSYLDDFTLKAAPGLTLAWAHSKGFPKSWFMLLSGAAQGPEFIDYARRSMVPTLVWYKAYPGLSAPNIMRNRRIRLGLIKAKQGHGNTSWLQEV